MAQLVNEWLRGMGITDAQYIVARHFDKTHPHCHLVFSRIDLNGNVISPFNERIKSAKVCKEIKLRHGLTFGNTTGDKVNRDRLLPVQQALFDLKTAVIAAADNASSWVEFQRELEAQGIEAYFSFNRTTGEVRGIFFAKGDYRFADSKLSKQKLTYGKLVVKFGALPVEGVDILSTPSRYHRLNSKEGTGKLTTPYQEPSDGIGTLQSSSRNQPVTDEGLSITESPFERVLPNSTTTEPSEVSLVPLSVIIDLLAGPAVVQSSGSGGTTNDLDWNDERRRRQEAQENQYVNRPFNRRR